MIDVMPKKRTFKKKITVQNFKAIKTESLFKSDNLSGKSIKELAEIEVEIFFTPRGYLININMLSPIIVWDFEQACKIKGITETDPDGDLADKNFTSELAAMHFVTRRLSRLGWEASDVWEWLEE